MVCMRRGLLSCSRSSCGLNLHVRGGTRIVRPDASACDAAACIHAALTTHACADNVLLQLLSMSASSSPPAPPPATPFLPPAEAVRGDGGRFRLKLVRSTWGLQGDLLAYFREAKAAGKSYEGYEAPLMFLSEEARQQLKTAREELGLEWTAMVFSDLTGTRHTVADHYAEWVARVEEATQHGAVQINSHSGKDSWSYAQSLEFFTLATQYGDAHPSIPISHETHRGRALYNPWVTRDLVAALPTLWLTADYSHWVAVCERLLDSEAEVLRGIAPRVRHIHARVGFENGPQVNDPRAPEWAGHVRAHERWWEEIFQAQQDRGATHITLVPEYGPGDKFTTYMPMMPYTQEPVANVADICDWAASRMQHKFKEALGGK